MFQWFTRRRPEITPATLEDETTKRYVVPSKGKEAIWVLEVIAGAEQGRKYLCTGEKVTIGRQPENHIQLDDPKVSRFHAVVQRRQTKLVVRDLQSTNGTFVNMKRVEGKQVLQPGDQIHLGAVVIQVSLERPRQGVSR